MWKHIRLIYENHIFVYPDVYISCDDIVNINNVIYEITGITDNSDIYLQYTNNKFVCQPPALLQMLLQDNNFKYTNNTHQECLNRNKICKNI